jgi:hypothetical protein
MSGNGSLHFFKAHIPLLQYLELIFVLIGEVDFCTVDVKFDEMVLLQVNIKLFVLKALYELLLSLLFKIANLAKIVCLICQESD